MGETVQEVLFYFFPTETLSTTFIQSIVNTGVRLSQRNTKTYSKIPVPAGLRVTIRLVRRHICYSPAGRSVLGETVQEVLFYFFPTET